jgi:hypothetical protein
VYCAGQRPGAIFAKIEIEYKEQDATGKLMGSIKKWFDLKSMKGG